MTFQFKLAKRLAINFVRAAVAVTVIACAADQGVGVIRPSASVVRVHILPDNPLIDPGQLIQFQASGITSAGDSLPIDVAWTATTGSITASGLYSADTSAQDAQISATYSDVSSGTTTTTSGTTKVRKSQVVQVVVSPTSATLPTGASQTFKANGVRSTGSTAAINAAFQASGGTITSGGTFTAGQVSGSYSVIAQDSRTGIADTVPVSIYLAPVAVVSVSPSAPSILAGSTVQLAADTKDAAGNTLTGRTISWASGNTSIATVSASGLVTGVVIGTATITATSEGQSGSTTVTVSPVPVASVSVTPASASLYTGGAAQLNAVAKDSAGNPLSGRAIIWTSSNAAIATVTASGLVTGVSAGAASITAASEGKSSSASITVVQVPVASLSVTPASASVNLGGTVQLSAAPRDSAGNLLSGRTVTWTSSNAAVATVAASGLVAGVSTGTATITATSEGKSGTANITVAQIPVASVAVSPGSAGIRTGGKVQLSAVTKDSAGNLLTGRVVAWASSNTAAATVSTSGLVTGVAAGSATITATSEGQSGSAAVTVTLVPVASVVVSPATASVNVGSTVQLAAVTKDSAGNTLTGRAIVWTSSNSTTASVSASGLVTGLVAGSVSITAASEGKSGSAAVTVTSTTVTHAGWYVSPSGSSSGAGSVASPWSLTTALSGAGGRIHPGDTVWVRGGTYYAPFQSTLSGTAAAPIIVRAYPGERAIIDGVNTTSDNFVVAGSYSIIWGLEFTNTNPSRYTSDATSHSYRADNIINDGPHNKYINVIVHDGGVGLYTYSAFPDVEIAGGIFYNNGWDAPDRGHGHALYLKNDNGPLVARDNIIFNQFGYGIHIYTNTGDGLLNGISAIGNVSFDNGSLSALGTSANLGNLGQPAANSLVVTDNMTYFAPSLSGTNLELGSGSGLTATGDYVVGGSGITQGSWTNATITGNSVFAAGPASRATAVFIRPNPYEVGRANIIVYNWSQQASVSLDLTAVLPVGAKYAIRNVQDLFGVPVLSGTYGGGAISLPLVGVSPPVPVGMSSSPAPSTGADFNVYVVTITP